MGLRSQLRQKERKEKKAKTVTYNFTEAQLDAVIEANLQKKLAEVEEQYSNQAINTAMLLMLTLPLEVLKEHYWPKTYVKKLPEFTNHVLDYYNRYLNGELDIDELKQDLWECAGIALEEGELE